MTEKLTRRGYLSLNWESTLGFFGNFLGPQLDMDRSFFRPPGAGKEFDFLTSCNRCGECKEVCPEHSISLLSLSSGAKLAGTPYLDPNEKPCTFCKKCIEICPTDALNSPEIDQLPKIGTAKIQQSFCLAYQDVMCDYCVRSCPVDSAIYLELGKPIIQEEICLGCGICASNCISENKAIRIKL